MALANGDYKAIEDKVVETLLDDTDTGGLKETGSEPVATITAGDEEIIKTFGQSRFPAILVRAASKTESPARPAYALIKSYSLAITALDRGMDRTALETSIRKIAARVEIVIREQTRTDKQFKGLPDQVDGSEGVMVASVAKTAFSETKAEQGEVMARAKIEAMIQIPCAFRYD